MSDVSTMKYVALLLFFITQAKGSPMPRIVYPRYLEERASDGRTVINVHDDLTLYLRKAPVAARTLRVLTEENGQPVTLFFKGEDIDRDLYEDENNFASLEVTRKKTGLSMRGLIGPQHRIEPMPLSGRLHNGVVPHAVYKIEQEEKLGKTVVNKEQPVIHRSFYYNWQEQPLKVPDVVTVELYFIVDAPHHNRFSTHQGLLSYLCVMTNSVNLRYGSAEAPRIKFLVTGADVSKNESYADLYTSNKEYIYDLKTLRNLMGYAFENNRKFGDPDVVYLMTGREVYTIINGSFAEGQGVGYVSGICTYRKVALGEDKPGLYSGIYTLTHELGHVLGAEHDGQGPAEVGHPGALSCPWNDGYIMSYVNIGPRHNLFSVCSLKQIQYVVSRAGEACWATKSSGYTVSGQYPGTLVPSVAFCKGDAAHQDSTVDNITVSAATCKVRCQYHKPYQWNTGRGFSVTRRYYYYRDWEALDYMNCGGTKVCILGRCTENPTKISGTVAERSDEFRIRMGSQT